MENHNRTDPNPGAIAANGTSTPRTERDGAQTSTVFPSADVKAKTPRKTSSGRTVCERLKGQLSDSLFEDSISQAEGNRPHTLTQSERDDREGSHGSQSQFQALQERMTLMTQQMSKQQELIDKMEGYLADEQRWRREGEELIAKQKAELEEERRRHERLLLSHQSPEKKNVTWREEISSRGGPWGRGEEPEKPQSLFSGRYRSPEIESDLDAPNTPLHEPVSRDEGRWSFTSPRGEEDDWPKQRPVLKVPNISFPRYKAGNSWELFLREFSDVAKMTGLSSAQLVPYLKQNLPEDGRNLLVDNGVTEMEKALPLLEKLYKPAKDSWTLFLELEKIVQKPGERMIVLASRIKDVAYRYAREVSSHMTHEELQKLICDRFRNALLDDDTKNQLFWNEESLPTLEQIVTKAQTFEDKRGLSKTPKKGLRTTEENSELVQLKSQVSELRRTVEEALKLVAKPVVSTKGVYEKSPVKAKRYCCWNCGDVGHQKRECPKDKIGDGFTHQPAYFRSRSRRPGKGGSQVQDSQKEHLNH